MVCAPVRPIIPSLKLGDYLSVQAHKPCSISHLVHGYIRQYRVCHFGFMISLLPKTLYFRNVFIFITAGGKFRMAEP